MQKIPLVSVDSLVSGVAKEFLEISSEQRLGILLSLNSARSKPSILAKELDATISEVFRNMERLVAAQMIIKDIDGFYQVTPYGKMICNQITSFSFISNNKKYFSNHNFDTLPPKFIQRIGALSGGKHIRGFTKVMECWQEIIDNSTQYVYGMVSEETPEIMVQIAKKAQNGVKINSVFIESTLVPKNRKKLIADLDIKKLIQDGTIERKMSKDLTVIVMLNEKQACILFPLSGEVDLKEAFFGDDESFHEWCLDYFRFVWHESKYFEETKLVD
jgi:predicted transcriptional regulator